MSTKQRDTTLDHPAVKLVRDTFKFCPNWGFRKEIIVSAEHDMELWKSVVRYWAMPYRDSKGRLKVKNPLAFKAMLAEFDRRYFG